MTAVSQAVQLPFSGSNWPTFSQTRSVTSERQSSRSWGDAAMGAMMYFIRGP